jgi:hypothetical protein
MKLRSKLLVIGWLLLRRIHRGSVPGAGRAPALRPARPWAGPPSR